MSHLVLLTRYIIIMEINDRKGDEKSSNVIFVSVLRDVLSAKMFVLLGSQVNGIIS